MRYISTFSGVEAATLAWRDLGWEAVAFSEVDEFPSEVLRERFPEVPNLGDVTKVDWSAYRGAADIVVGGSPCQSFSIAGGRAGLDGASGLMWEYVRCVREVMPEWIVWENVRGALSSSHGEDFGCLLRSLDDLGYGLAWRVLDAQFFGVAQRRERVFLVGRLGDVEGPCEVLFDSEGLRGNPESSRKKREALAAGASGGAGASGFRWHQGSGAGSIGLEKEQSPTLDCTKPPAALCMTDTQPPVTMKMRGGKPGGGKGPLLQTDMSATLATSNDQTLFQPRKQVSGACEGYEVRKLTPRECERLMGMPDDWTKIPYRGKSADECPDGPRYRAIGNSMAVSVMKWIGARIDAIERGIEPDEACSRIRGEIFGNKYRKGLFSRQ